MTCIAGVVHRKHVTLMGDTCGASYSHRAHMGSPKVFTRGDIAFGVAGCFRFMQLLHHVLPIPDRDPRCTDMEYLAGPLAFSIGRCLSDNGALRKKDEVAESEGQALIGYRGHLYLMLNSLAIIEQHDGIAAIGSGGDYALGALAVLGGSPAARLTKALSAAAVLCPGVLAPFHAVTV